MIRLAIIGVCALVLASHFGFVPHNPATFVLGAALATLAMIWAGLFARS
ncbi:hypothetical protein [Phreatobacter sp.]